MKIRLFKIIFVIIILVIFFLIGILSINFACHINNSSFYIIFIISGILNLLIFTFGFFNFESFFRDEYYNDYIKFQNINITYLTDTVDTLYKKNKTINKNIFNLIKRLPLTKTRSKIKNYFRNIRL